MNGTSDRAEEEHQQQEGQQDHRGDQPRKPVASPCSPRSTERRGHPADVRPSRCVRQRLRQHLRTQPGHRLASWRHPAGRWSGRRPGSRLRPPDRRRPAPRGDAGVIGDGAAQRLDHGRVLGDVDGDDQRPVDAGTEAVGDQLVGPALGAVGRQRAVVRDAQPQREQRARASRSSTAVPPTAYVHGVPGHVSPHRRQRSSTGTSARRGAATPDPVTGQPEEAPAAG